MNILDEVHKALVSYIHSEGRQPNRVLLTRPALNLLMQDSMISGIFTTVTPVEKMKLFDMDVRVVEGKEPTVEVGRFV